MNKELQIKPSTTDNELNEFIRVHYQQITGQSPQQEETSIDLLKKSFKFLKDIIQQSPGHIYWLNTDNIYLGCNERHARNAGLTNADEIFGKTNDDLSWKDQAKALNDMNNKVMQDKQIFQAEEFIITAGKPEGGIYFSEKKPLFDENGEVIGLMGTSLEITEKKQQEIALVQAKQNEEELRKAAMIFAGSVAHDLTTPLTNINLMANNVSNMLPELLKIYQTIETNKQNLNEKQLAYLEKFPESLQAQLTELNEYIKDSLKALNKTVAGIKTQDDLVKCELWRCMQKVIDEYPYVENEKDLIHWDTSYLFDFMGNPLLFYRIMFNLIKNSLYQIREKGRGEIFIRAEQTDTHNVLYFKDTAGGVTQETVDNIFNSYQTTKAEGTGVGLAFCKLTMQSFGGEMDCQLMDGKFIEFGLRFLK